MGNFSSKENHGATGGHPDIFHTPPTSPTSDVPLAKRADLSLSSLVAPVSCPPPVPAKTPLPQCTGRKTQPGNAPTTPMPPPDWKPPIPPASPTSLMIGGSGESPPASPEVQVAPPAVCNGGPFTSTPALRAQGTERRGGTSSPAINPVVLDTPASPVASPPDRDWRERDSGLSCPTTEGQREEMETTLEKCRTTLGITQDGAPSTTELLKCLLTEINSLRSNLQTERNEWLQFQTDLQVAVAVADRLRAEAEEEQLALRGAHKEMERELAAAHQRQREADTQLESLRAELSESRQKLATVPQAHGQTQAQALTEARERSPDSCANNCEGGLGGTDRGRTRGLHGPGREGTENGSPIGTAVPNAAAKGEETQTDSRGVARRYMRNVSSGGGSKEMSRTNETRRTGTTERSRSLSRIAPSLDSHTVQNGTFQSNTGTTASSYPNKNSNQPRGHRSLDWPDSSSANAGKREELLNKYNSALSELPPTKSQDGFNMLLRRHGGSKRNSLLRWCQNRTLGYKNIDLTNFSSSWADGLAFCAVYHTYLPSQVPYTLNPEDKRENLNLAFKTGESVGITRSLTVDEMLRAGGPDWHRVLSYVESMYRHFEM